MTITQTVEIPESRRLTIEVPREVPAGRTILTFTPAPERNYDSETGNPRYNAETVAAIKEGRAMMRGEIPTKRFSSLDEMWEDLMREDEDKSSIDEPSENN